MKQKRFMSLLLTLCMLFTLAPMSVFADETITQTPVSATVSFTTQAEGAFLQAPQNNITISSDLAESYGYTDGISSAEGVSALDALVKAHQLAFGDDFTTEYKDTMLKVENDSIKIIFGVETYNCGFAVNGKTPHDDVLIESEYGDYYTGYTVNSVKIKDNDFLEFFLYQDSYAMDNYIWFEKDNAKIDSLLIKENTDTTLTVKGYSIGWYGCNTQESIDSLTTEIGSVQLCLVDSETGSATDINGAITGENGIVTFSVADKGEYLLSAYSTNDLTPAIMPLIKLKVGYPDAAITIPSTSKLFIGVKKTEPNSWGGITDVHFVPFTEYEPIIMEEGVDTTTYYFDIPDNTQCNYRVSGENHLTYTGLFKKTANYELVIDTETLNANGTNKKAIDRNTANNNGFNVADIYLNINPQGYLKLNTDETYQLVNLRNWEAVDSTTNNYFLESDYHYTVIDENGNADDSIIEISKEGVITAKSSGTAIVLVTYDAFNNVSAVGGPFFGAIWPENTGVFVVGVGLEDSGITTNMTANVGENSTDSKLSGDAIDAEHDVIYFVGDTGSYTFTPGTEDCAVSVANPTVTDTLSYTGFKAIVKAEDNSFSVPLTEGRNIVKIEKDNKAEYQIITAKKVNITINNGDAVKPGDILSIEFDRLYHPANKLAGVYNMSAFPLYTEVSGYDNDKLIAGMPTQYTFASNRPTYTIENILKKNVGNWGMVSYAKEANLIVPVDYPYDTFYLSKGAIFSTGYGDPYGNHRSITLEVGKDPNFTASKQDAYLGLLPDIEIPITAPGSELKSISLTVADVKTEYYIGDSFDTTNLVVTANYEDEKTQLTENYTVTPTVLDADTEKVIITYRGQTAEIPVIVKEDKVSAVNIKNNPDKVSYKAGETFDPTGMVVEAVYNSGKKTETYEYTYEPKRALNTDDTQITVAYIGTDADENVLSAAVPISVTSSGGGVTSSPSDKITVYFTLYGDKKHGTPTNATGTHTLADGNLTTWIQRTAIEIERGSYVIDVVKKALGLNGIPYSNPSGNYIESIKGLGELDNGSESGWMYTLNGKHPELGVGEQTVKNNDKIVFHYTDSYSKEDSADKWESSGGSGGGFASQYSVTFDTNGGSSISSVKVDKNEVLAVPTKPLKDGYTFAGWYTDKALTKEYDFTTKVTKSFTLYAKWELADGEIVPSEVSFNDTKNHWASEAIEYVYSKNIMQGVGESLFAPDETMTRAMLACVLYRLEDEPKVNKSIPFADVKSGEWYANAVTWAQQNGIVSGVSETEFAPNTDITREQMATILYRYAQYKKQDTSVGENTNILSYDDAFDISEYAYSAMQWMVGAGLMKGETDSTINPQNHSTRAQVATILMRYLEM